MGSQCITRLILLDLVNNLALDDLETVQTLAEGTYKKEGQYSSEKKHQQFHVLAVMLIVITLLVK